MWSSLCVMTQNMKVPCTQAGEHSPLGAEMFRSGRGQKNCPLHWEQKVALSAGCTEELGSSSSSRVEAYSTKWSGEKCPSPEKDSICIKSQPRSNIRFQGTLTTSNRLNKSEAKNNYHFCSLYLMLIVLLLFFDCTCFYTNWDSFHKTEKKMN